MRMIIAFALATAAGARAQEPKPPSEPLAIAAFTFTPNPAPAGTEITVSATLRNTTPRLLLASVRLVLPGEVSIVLPDAEQTLFFESGASRDVRWKAKVEKEGPWKMRLERTVISEGRPVNGQPVRVPEPVMMALGKVWAGTWTSPDGYVYDAEFRGLLDPSGAVEGRLDWTLRKAPEERTDYAGKIGAKGVEYVWGVYNPLARSLDMEGYRRDDPKLILGLDRYRLTLSEDFKEIKGATWNHGTWAAAFRMEPK
jgi:hypothetical protein